jgi:hypothetical protein
VHQNELHDQCRAVKRSPHLRHAVDNPQLLAAEYRVEPNYRSIFVSTNETVVGRFDGTDRNSKLPPELPDCYRMLDQPVKQPRFAGENLDGAPPIQDSMIKDLESCTPVRASERIEGKAIAGAFDLGFGIRERLRRAAGIRSHNE